jgi:heme/copper-type cytochrome/quinol oxidase subunit 2
MAVAVVVVVTAVVVTVVAKLRASDKRNKECHCERTAGSRGNL